MKKDKGILGRSTNAVDKHKIAEIKERVELKVAEDVEKFHEEKYVDFSINMKNPLKFSKIKWEHKFDNLSVDKFT